MPQAPLSPKLNYTIMTTSSPSSLPPKNPSPAIVDTNARPPRTTTSQPDPGASEHQHKPCNQPRGSKDGGKPDGGVTRASPQRGRMTSPSMWAT
ncbi:hypothetical protein CGMCC3_g13199 [Colletotrichum fructicola]|nr:uncharacterized protein CGMCC3_g13199 [Colletotrichum fructicola]KAE9570762.1 hypothetical protein CGMCC3_g13199 [Colletotrichum fructicola]